MDIKQFLAQSDWNSFYNRYKKEPENIIEIKRKISSLSASDLTELKWIWEATAELLISIWISTIEELKSADISYIKEKIKNPLVIKSIENAIH